MIISHQLYARDATAAPKANRQTQIEGMFFDGPNVAPCNHRHPPNKYIGKMHQSKSMFEGSFKGLWGAARMREPLEMYTASRMQHMVHTRKNNAYFATNLLFQFCRENVLLGLSALRAPTVGPYECNPNEINTNERIPKCRPKSSFPGCDF